MMFVKSSRLGWIIPRIILVFFLADIATRLTPLDGLSFRAWEPLRRYRAPCGAFRVNSRYENGSSYGDLASLGNLPAMREYRHEVFSTDGFGFRRNADTGNDGPYRALLVGDSMSVGPGLTDNETLAARLERKWRTRVYNGASAETDPQGLNHILFLTQRLHITEGTVIYEYLERHDLPRAEELVDLSSSSSWPCESWRSRFSVWLEGFSEISGLQIVAERVYKSLSNDLIFPNPFKSSVERKTLKNGEPILFYPEDIRSSRMRRSVDVSGFQEFAAELQKRNLRLVVLLVPNKYTVYGPLLKDDDALEGETPLFLNEVEKALREASIPVVNLVNLFRQKAQEDYKRHVYIYWRDDIHWNSRGVELAAEEISEREPMPVSVDLARTLR
jgi:hypothetical protein